MNPILSAKLARIQLASLAIGLVAGVACVIGAATGARQFYFSYLSALMFWGGLGLGCLAVTMIHHLTGGRWGYPIRRILEAGFMTLPLMLPLFVPIFFGLGRLYPWARPAEVAAAEDLRYRAAYENEPGYIIRQIIFLLVFICFAFLLRRWSCEQDLTTDAEPTRKARALSGAGIVVYGLVGTFACIDWILSLENHWYSTMFGVIFLIGQILAAYAFGVVALAFVRNWEPFTKIVQPVHYHHLGNLMLTFVLFWTYVSFGQLLIIYSGDIPHETEWYRHRIAGDWKFLIGAIALFHFFLPFLLLLFRAVKKHAVSLTALAAVLLLMRVADSYWLVMPTLHQHGVAISWMDFAAFIAVGGLWLAWFVACLKARPLVPVNDPGLQFSFVYAEA